MPKGIALDARLGCCARLAGKCGLFADIGCDHGRLGAHMLLTGAAQRVMFTDLSAPSLKKARVLVDKIGRTAQAEFFVGDGAESLPETPDAAVIAGMGGETMAGVILRGQDRLTGARLVLQPGVDAPLVRDALTAIGYRIDKEEIVRAGGRLYIAIAAVPGKAEYTASERVIGPALLAEDPPLLSAYAAFRMRVLREALAGAEAGQDALAAARARDELSAWEECGKWQ